MTQTTTSTTTPAPAPKKSQLEKMEDKATELEVQLKALKLSIKSAKQKKAAIETNAKRKLRTRLLVLGGLALSQSIRTQPKNINYFTDRFKETQQDPATDKAEEGRALFKLFIEQAQANEL